MLINIKVVNLISLILTAMPTMGLTSLKELTNNPKASTQTQATSQCPTTKASTPSQVTQLPYNKMPPS
jgi:hypothetical protein